MQFLKKHYEKILLSAVLLGLAATAAWFYGAVKEANATGPGPMPPPKALAALELGPAREAVANLDKPPALDLTGSHHLFNPETWKVRRDGSLYSVVVQGAAALTVTNISPLYYTITYDWPGLNSVRLTETTGDGRRRSSFFKIGETNKGSDCILTGTNAAPDGSIISTLKILDSGETVTVATNNPYKRVDGYQADLEYAPDMAVFTRKRVNDTLPLSGETYKIIAITNNAVTVQGTKNIQPTPIPWSGH